MTTEFSPSGLRILREVAQAGSFSAAAQSLGYTQSAVSRQVAALEVAAGRRLFDRSRTGVTLTPPGARLLSTAVRVLDELDVARRKLTGETETVMRPVRLGAFATAAAGLIPAALATLPRDLKVTVREATTPALTRALRAGTLDLAVIAQQPPFRPPDAESPPLELTALSERELVVGVAANHPLAAAGAEVDRLEGQVWVASRSDGGDSLLGVWPGLRERPDVRYVVRDWLAKLQIVAAGLAITTIAPVMREVLPAGVSVIAVRGEPQEMRRLVLARRPGPRDPVVARVTDALLGAAQSLGGGPRS
ncbi:MAG: LysR family transcriptional regulator [Solirubrobacteraceae bacterium]